MGEKTPFLPKKSSNGKNTYDSTQRALRKGINICQCSPRKVGGRFQMRGAVSVGSRRMCRSLRQEHPGGENDLGRGRMSGRWSRKAKNGGRLLSWRRAGRLGAGASKFRPHFGEAQLKHARGIKRRSRLHVCRWKKDGTRRRRSADKKRKSEDDFQKVRIRSTLCVSYWVWPSVGIFYVTTATC